MTWKFTLGTAALLTAAVISLAGCGETTESANAQASTATAIERPQMPEIDYAAAAAKLGVTEQQLQDALATESQRPPDLSTAAAALGVTEEALRDALGFPAGNQPPGSPPSGIPPAGQGGIGIPE